MAWDFAAEIHNLTGYDADDASGTATDGTAFSLQADRWLVDGARVVINRLPNNLKVECSTMTALTSTTPMDLDLSGPILYVTRENADSGFHTPCRRIPPEYGGMASSSSGHMIYEASVTDPVYWTTSNSSDAATLFVKPTPTANQTADVYHVSYPTVAYNTTKYSASSGKLVIDDDNVGKFVPSHAVELGGYAI